MTRYPSHRTRGLALLAALLAAAACAAECRADVLRVLPYEVPDGNTVIALTESGIRVTVRLHGMLAPAGPSLGVPGQPGWRDARQALRKALGGKGVTVRVVRREKGGAVAGIVTANGACVNREMVASGWAWAYLSGPEGPRVSEYADDEARARERKVGLWKQGDPVPPWRYGKNPADAGTGGSR